MSATSIPKSILIVDDTPINIGVISGALKDSFFDEGGVSRPLAGIGADGRQYPHTPIMHAITSPMSVSVIVSYADILFLC